MAGQTEQELRIQLAACYRIFDYLGWSEMIFNHITMKVPSDQVLQEGDRISVTPTKIEGATL